MKTESFPETLFFLLLLHNRKNSSMKDKRGFEHLMQKL